MNGEPIFAVARAKLEAFMPEFSRAILPPLVPSDLALVVAHVTAGPLFEWLGQQARASEMGDDMRVLLLDLAELPKVGIPRPEVPPGHVAVVVSVGGDVRGFVLPVASAPASA